MARASAPSAGTRALSRARGPQPGNDRELADETQLVARVVADRPGAVAELIDRYGNLVRRVVHRMVDDPRDREEIWQDTFVLTVRALPRFRGHARLSTWIGRIAYRECVRYLRRRKLPLEGAGGAPGVDTVRDPAPPPVDQMLLRELEAVVHRAIDRLPPVQKAAITLFYLEQMSVAEVSEVMAVPENTVKSHLHRARRWLRELLEKEAEDRGYTR